MLCWVEFHACGLGNSYAHRWRRQWHPTPLLLPGKSHGRRSLVGCSLWGHEESDTTERLHFHALEKEWQPTPVFLPGESQGRGAWWAAVYGVTQSRTRLKRLSSSSMPIGHQSNRMKMMGSVLRKQRVWCIIIGKMSIYIKQRQGKRIL